MRVLLTDDQRPFQWTTERVESLRKSEIADRQKQIRSRRKTRVLTPDMRLDPD